jgi:hypothetical protein
MLSRFARSCLGLGLLAAVVGTPARAADSTRVEPGSGITFSTEDGSSSLNLGLFGQFRFQDLDRDQYQRSNLDETTPPFSTENIGGTEPSFQMRRLRVFARGSVYKPWITYKLELDLAANDEGLRSVFMPEWTFSSFSPSFPEIDIHAGNETKDNRTVKTVDFYVDFAPRTYAGVRLGAFKVPFGRQELVSDYKIQMTARSVASDLFAPSRDRGAMFYGGTPTRKIEWKVGAFNGTGLGQGQNLDHYLGYAVRLTAARKGPYLDLESVLDTEVPSGVRVQGGFSWYSSTDTPTRQDPRTPLGNVDDTRLEVDYEMFWKRASLTLDYYTRSIRVDAVGSATGRPGIDLPTSCTGAFLEGRLTCDQQGYNVQGGMMFGSRSELSARYSMVDYDKELSQDEVKEATLNFTRYLRKHALKWSVSASYFHLGINAQGSSAFKTKTSKVNSLDMTEFFLDPNAFPGLEADRNWLLTAQIQFGF